VKRFVEKSRTKEGKKLTAVVQNDEGGGGAADKKSEREASEFLSKKKRGEIKTKGRGGKRKRSVSFAPLGRRSDHRKKRANHGWKRDHRPREKQQRQCIWKENSSRRRGGGRTQQADQGGIWKRDKKGNPTFSSRGRGK